ncbi:MAG: hypothetical protein Tsb0020_07910 [Haliangiales bacterium]
MTYDSPTAPACEPAMTQPTPLDADSAPADALLHETTGLCGTCKRALPARIHATADGEVWMHKRCPSHGPQAVRISTNADWYQRMRAIHAPANPPPEARKPVDHGCPFDCGPCDQHQQRVRLPVVTVTSACNLDCPICYVHNKNEDAYHMPPAEFGQVLDHLVADHGGSLDLINLTGGDPTLHPQLIELLQMSHAAGIHRVAICTNGLKLISDPELLERLAALDVRIALSFQSFDDQADFEMQGAHLVAAKQRCLEVLEAYDLDTTLIPVMTKGLNDHEIGAIIEMGLSRKNVRHIEVHTMTYTGQGGVNCDRSGRISMYEVLERIEETTAGLLRPDHFVPSPCAHAHCYQIAYLLIDPDGGPPVPFLDFVTADEMYLALSEHLYLEPSPQLESILRAAIDRLWVEDRPDSERILGILKRFLRTLFPTRPLSRAEALRAGERAVKAIYVHSHMDEETFDVERLADCCDSNCYADGTTIPVCAYNVLYRDKERRFMDTPARWDDRSGGRKKLPIYSP